MSDISEFAEWEAQQQHQQDSNEAAGLTERQQKLMDMAHEHRIWKDRDSSNDFRSSESGSDSQDRDDVHVKWGGRGSVPLGNGGRNRLQIPSFTQSTQLQKLDSDDDEEEVSCASSLGKWRGFVLGGRIGLIDRWRMYSIRISLRRPRANHDL
jgi:hypothetical protein